MPSSVVFLAILVIWAVILAPRVMALYARTSTHRSTQRFSAAMSALGAAHSKPVSVRVAALRRREHLVASHVDSAVVAEQVVDDSPAQSPARRTARAEATARRRRTTLILAAALSVTVLAWTTGLLPVVVPVAVGLALAGVLGVGVAARRRCVAERKANRARARRRERQRDEAAALPTTVAAARRVIPGATEADRARGARDPLAAEVTDNVHAERGAGGQSTARSTSAALVVPPGIAPAAGSGELTAARSRRSFTTLPGMWTTAKVIEQDEALAATYVSEEQRLGLEEYVPVPGAAEEHDLPRVVSL